MKKIFIAILALLHFFTSNAQLDTLIYEDFEKGSPYKVNTYGNPPWLVDTNNALNSSRHSGAIFMKGFVDLNNHPGDSSFLESDYFQTIGNCYVGLKFSHIGKISPFRAGIIELSIDSGQTWTQIKASNSFYYGDATSFNQPILLPSKPDSFNVTSYPFPPSFGLPNWVPSSPLFVSSQMWVQEYFDISALAANQTAVKIRFKLLEINLFNTFYAGWHIDDILIESALDETVPPEILHQNIYSGKQFEVDSFEVNVNVIDSSKTHQAWLVYQINNGSKDSVLMNRIGSSGRNETWQNWLTQAQMGFLDGDTINYYVSAFDSSKVFNYAKSSVFSFIPSGNPLINYPSSTDSTLLGLRFGLGPFPLFAYAQDASGIDSVFLNYRINNGSLQRLSMNHLSGKIYGGIIPAVNDSDEICYYVSAIDASIKANTTRKPDTSCRSFTVTNSQIIFFDDFEQGNFWTASKKNTNQVGWELGLPNQAILNSAFSGSNAWMTDLNANYSSSAEWILESPIIDFSNLINAQLSFWQKSQLQPSDGFQLQYTTDVNSQNPNWIILGNGNLNDPNALQNWYNNSIIQALISQGWSRNFSNWTKSSYILSDLNQIGMVKFRFVFKSLFSFTNNEGIVIDDFMIRLPKSLSIETTNISFSNLFSQQELFEGDSVALGLELINTGKNNIDTVDITYTVNGSNPVHYTYINSISPKGRITIAQNVLPKFIAPAGNTEVCVSTQVRGDTTVNTFCRNIWSVPNFQLPFQDNFDAANLWTTRSNNLSVQSTWKKGTPNKTILDSAFSPPNAWATELMGNYQNQGIHYLYSPTFDLEAHTSYNLAFYQKRVLDTAAVFWVEYSFDRGFSWIKLGVFNDGSGINWYNDPIGFIDTLNQYQESSYSLFNSSGFNRKVRFRFAFDGFTGSEGIAIDDFKLEKVIGTNLNLQLLYQPIACPNLQADSISIRFSVTNIGNDTIQNIPFNYSFNGMSQLANSFVWQGVLNPLESKIIMLPTIASSMVGPYQFCVYSELINDINKLNDTICREICGNMAQEIQLISFTEDTCHFEGLNYSQGVLLQNNGHSVVNNLTLNHQTNNGAIVSENFTALNLLPGNSMQINFTNPLNFSSGQNNLAIFISKLNSDLIQLNDTLKRNLFTSKIQTAPYKQGLNSTDYCTLKSKPQGRVNPRNSSACNGSSALSFYSLQVNTAWVNTNIANIWNPNVNPEFLSSACLLIDSKNNEHLRLKYIRDYNGAGTTGAQQIFYRILVNGNPIFEEQLFSTSIKCEPKSIDLSPFYTVGDTLIVEFQAKIQFVLGVVMSDIEILNLADSSLAISEILPNPIQLKPNKNTHVSVWIKNTGDADLDSANLVLEANGQIIQNQNFNLNSLKTGESRLVSFSNSFVPRNAPNNICVYQALPDDEPTDDTLCIIRNPAFEQNYPYCQNFEQSDGDWLNLTIADSLTNIWEFGSPNQTQINSAHSGSNAWMTGLNDNYQNFADAHLITPGFEVKKDSCYQLSFWHQYLSQNNIDGGTVEYSVDGGTNWRQLGKFGDSDWFSHQAIQSLWDFNSSPILQGSGWSGNSAGWQEAINRFKLNRDGVVHFRFRFASDVSGTNEGWAIDDFCFERLNSACTGVSVQELNWDEISVQVYPNPSNGKFYFQMDLEASKDQTIQITITDFLGKTIIQKNIKASENQPLELDLSDFSAGLYHYQIKINNKKTNGKLVKY